jgi:hypothetical protein
MEKKITEKHFVQDRKSAFFTKKYNSKMLQKIKNCQFSKDLGSPTKEKCS